jgi:hypothetical protein
MSYKDIPELVGKTLTSIKSESDEIVFNCATGESYKMYHQQDCCESVGLEDIDGDILDLIGSPILEASERSENDTRKETTKYGTGTWTFYVIRTVKASVTIRWYGSSNGYYSESVDFIQQ